MSNFHNISASQPGPTSSTEDSPARHSGKDTFPIRGPVGFANVIGLKTKPFGMLTPAESQVGLTGLRSEVCHARKI